MGDNSKISWCDATWNPISGCTKVSDGCRFCYSATFANRQMGPWKGRAFTDVQCHPDRLDQPLRWKRPRRIFVNSMSDLFHPDVPDGFIDSVFGVMALATAHTFQVLTKRPSRMKDYFAERGRKILPARVADAASVMMLPNDIRRMSWDYPAWPLPNVWLGVSVEDQQTTDERIPLLLQTPAAVRFVSCEPLLGPVNLRVVAPKDDWHIDAFDTPDPNHRLHWVIVGGESGPRARPCNVTWIRSLVQQCAAVGPCFVKQLGSNSIAPTVYGPITFDPDQPVHLERVLCLSGKGADMTEWPAALDGLRVQEWPDAR